MYMYVYIIKVFTRPESVTSWIQLRWLMIAFVTCKSSLVPLFEGLCTSNPCRFEFSVFWVFAGLFWQPIRVSSFRERAAIIGWELCVCWFFLLTRVRKIRNEAPSLHWYLQNSLFYHVASSPGSPLSRLFDRHRVCCFLVIDPKGVKIKDKASNLSIFFL